VGLRRARERIVATALTMLSTIAFVAIGTRSGAQSTTEKAPPTAKLSWVRMPGAEGCIDASALEAHVSARLGRDAFAAPPTLAIEGVVERGEKKWIARLWVRAIDGAPLGTRTLESEATSCDSLGDAVAFAVALAIDPQRALDASPSTSTSAPASSSSAKPPKIAPRPTASATISTTSTSSATTTDDVRVPALTVSAALGAGLVPKVAAGATLGFDPDVTARVRPVIAAALFPSRRTDDGTLGVGLSYGGVGACARAAGGRSVSLDGCALVLAGATHASVYDVEPIEPGDRFWLGASTGARFHLELAPMLALDVGVDAIFPWIRRRFDAVGASQRSTLFTQPFVGFVSSVGLAVRFDGR
jgi:hypothetical protein